MWTYLARKSKAFFVLIFTMPYSKNDPINVLWQVKTENLTLFGTVRLALLHRNKNSFIILFIKRLLLNRERYGLLRLYRKRFYEQLVAVWSRWRIQTFFSISKIFYFEFKINLNFKGIEHFCRFLDSMIILKAIQWK